MSVKDISERNRLVGQMALPADDIAFEQPRIRRAHDLLVAHFDGLPADAKAENRRNVVYTSIVDAGSPHAYGERFAYHADAIPAAELPGELDLLRQMGVSKTGLDCIEDLCRGERTPSIRYSLAEQDGRFRESFYGPTDTMKRVSHGVQAALLKRFTDNLRETQAPFELLVAWGFDIVNGDVAGVKLYTYVLPAMLPAYAEFLAERWGVKIPPAVWALKQRFGFARRYDLDGSITSIKLVMLTVFVDPAPAAQLSGVIQPLLKDVSSDAFDLPWDRIRMRSFNFDYAPTGTFQKCIAYYYYPRALTHG